MWSFKEAIMVVENFMKTEFMCLRKDVDAPGPGHTKPYSEYKDILYTMVYQSQLGNHRGTSKQDGLPRSVNTRGG